MLNNENEYIEIMEKEIENKIIKERIGYLLKWYSKKSTRCKLLYYFCASISIIIPALITLITSCTTMESTEFIYFLDYKCVISLLSTIATIVAGILALTRWQEGWIRYRTTIEIIKSSLTVYLVERESPQEDIKKMDEKFIKEIEEIVKNENMEWLRTRKNQKQENVAEKKRN